MEELYRLQTCPKGFAVTGGHTEMKRHLGNAVPSLMAEILGKEVTKLFFGEEVESQHKL